MGGGWRNSASCFPRSGQSLAPAGCCTLQRPLPEFALCDWRNWIFDITPAVEKPRLYSCSGMLSASEMAGVLGRGKI